MCCYFAGLVNNGEIEDFVDQLGNNSNYLENAMHCPEMRKVAKKLNRLPCKALEVREQKQFCFTLERRSDCYFSSSVAMFVIEIHLGRQFWQVLTDLSAKPVQI